MEISLNSTLKGITSIDKDNTKIALGSNQITLTPDSGANLTLTKSDTDKVKISGVANGESTNDAVNFGQLEASKLHFLSVNGGNEKNNNYNNDGAKVANAVAIGVNVEARAKSNGGNAEAKSTVLVGHNLSTDVNNSVVMGSNINIDIEKDDNKKHRKTPWSPSVAGSNSKMHKAPS